MGRHTLQIKTILHNPVHQYPRTQYTNIPTQIGHPPNTEIVTKLQSRSRQRIKGQQDAARESKVIHTRQRENPKSSTHGSERIQSHQHTGSKRIQKSSTHGKQENPEVINTREARESRSLQHQRSKRRNKRERLSDATVDHNLAPPSK
jgi:hypothetical protein